MMPLCDTQRAHLAGNDAQKERRSPAKKIEPTTRIELALSAWEADVLPLNYVGDVAHCSTGRREAKIALT